MYKALKWALTVCGWIHSAFKDESREVLKRSQRECLRADIYKVLYYRNVLNSQSLFKDEFTNKMVLDGDVLRSCSDAVILY